MFIECMNYTLITNETTYIGHHMKKYFSKHSAILTGFIEAEIDLFEDDKSLANRGTTILS